MVLFKRDIFGLLKLNQKLCSSPDSNGWCPNCFTDHSLKFSYIPSFQSLCMLVKEFPSNRGVQRGSPHTRKICHKKAKGKEDMHKLESERLLPIWICQKTHYQCSTGKLPLLQFFLHFFRQLGLGPPNETSIAWKTYLGTAQNLLQLDFSRSTLFTPIFSNFFHSHEIFFSHILYTSVTAAW